MQMLCHLMWLYGNEGFTNLAQSRFLLKCGQHTSLPALPYCFLSTLSILLFILIYFFKFCKLQIQIEVCSLVFIHPSIPRHPSIYSPSIHFLPLRGALSMRLQKSKRSAVIPHRCFSGSEKPSGEIRVGEVKEDHARQVMGCGQITEWVSKKS